MNEQEIKDTEKKLQRLLRLKKYEVPPPGFFPLLHRKIMEDVEALNQRPSFIRSLLNQAFSFEFTPKLAGALGFSACILVCGVLLLNQAPEGVRQVEQLTFPEFKLVEDRSEERMTSLISSLSETNPLLAHTNNPFEPPPLKVQRVDY